MKEGVTSTLLQVTALVCTNDIIGGEQSGKPSAAIIETHTQLRGVHWENALFPSSQCSTYEFQHPSKHILQVSECNTHTHVSIYSTYNKYTHILYRYRHKYRH